MSRQGARGDHGYAMIVTMSAVLVVGALAAMLITTTQSSLRSTKRSGDSANALQVADAGVNAAVKQLTDWTGSSPMTINYTLPGSGDRYEVVASRENPAVWHVNSLGTDRNGVQRRVRATAVADSIFANAVFAKGTINFGSGVAVDSYTGGAPASAGVPDQTCTGKGFAGSNDPANNDINVNGLGGGVRNCGGVYVYDGCTGYADEEPVPAFKNEALNATKHTCGSFARRTPKFSLSTRSTEGLTNLGVLNCNGPLNLAPGRYLYSQINLGTNCVIPRTASSPVATQENPVYLITSGGVNIGTGNGDRVNAPPQSTGVCAGTPAVGNDLNSGWQRKDRWMYCPRWAGRVQIHATGPGSVNFGNHVEFWGVVIAPDRTIGGGPQSVVWGSFAGNSIDSGAQIAVHFDEALSELTTGKFSLVAWREERL